MLIQFFLILFGGSLALLITGIKFRRWLLCLMSTVLSAVCAFQAFRIELVSGGVTLVFQEVVIVLLCWAITLIGFIFTLLGAVWSVQEMNAQKKKQHQGAVNAG